LIIILGVAWSTT